MDHLDARTIQARHQEEEDEDFIDSDTELGRYLLSLSLVDDSGFSDLQGRDYFTTEGLNGNRPPPLQVDKEKERVVASNPDPDPTETTTKKEISITHIIKNFFVIRLNFSGLLHNRPSKYQEILYNEFPNNQQMKFNWEEIQEIEAEYRYNCLYSLAKPKGFFGSIQKFWYLTSEIIKQLVFGRKESLQLFEEITSFILCLNKIWNHLYSIGNDIVFEMDLEAEKIFEQLKQIFWSYLIQTSDLLEVNAKCLCRFLSNFDEIKDRIFHTQETTQMSYVIEGVVAAATANEDSSPNILHVQYLTELTLNQLIEYLFQYSVLILKVPETNYCAMDLVHQLRVFNERLSTDYWEQWNNFNLKRSSELREKENQNTNFVHNQLIRTSNELSNHLKAFVKTVAEINKLTNDLKVQHNLAAEEENLLDQLNKYKHDFKDQLNSINQVSAKQKKLMASILRVHNLHSSSPETDTKINNDTSIKESGMLPLAKEDNAKDTLSKLNYETENYAATAEGENLPEEHDQDQVLELNLLNCDSSDEDSNESEDNVDKIDSSVSKAQMQVLRQLKTTLELRRSEMRSRETQAYFRKYGRYPPDDDLDEQTNRTVTVKEKKDLPYEFSAGGPEISSTLFSSIRPALEGSTVKDRADTNWTGADEAEVTDDEDVDDAFFEEPATLSRPSLEFFKQLKNIYGHSEVEGGPDDK